MEELTKFILKFITRNPGFLLKYLIRIFRVFSLVFIAGNLYKYYVSDFKIVTGIDQIIGFILYGHFLTPLAIFFITLVAFEFLLMVIIKLIGWLLSYKWRSLYNKFQPAFILAEEKDPEKTKEFTDGLLDNFEKHTNARMSRFVDYSFTIKELFLVNIIPMFDSTCLILCQIYICFSLLYEFSLVWLIVLILLIILIQWVKGFHRFVQKSMFLVYKDKLQEQNQLR